MTEMNSMKKAVFVDRDNTLNYDFGYVHRLEDLKVCEKIVSLLKEYQDKGYIIIVISNQSGIGRGYFPKEDTERFNAALKEEFLKKGINISSFYYCPHKPEDNCRCRKPKTGLIDKVVKNFDINLEESVVIGDKQEIDGEMARRLGIKFIHFQDCSS